MQIISGGGFRNIFYAVHVSKQVIPHRLLAEGIFGRSLISRRRSLQWMDPHLLCDTDFIPGAIFLHNHPIYPDSGPALGLPYASLSLGLRLPLGSEPCKPNALTTTLWGHLFSIDSHVKIPHFTSVQTGLQPRTKYV